MRRVLISSAVASLVLLVQPAEVDARGINSLVRHTFSAPMRLIGGLGGVRHHRHAARSHRLAVARAAAQNRTASRNTEEPTTGAVTAVPGAGHGPRAAPNAGPWISAYDDLFGYVLAPSGNAEPFWKHGAPDMQAAVISTGPRGNTAAAPAATCPERHPDGIVGWPMEKVEQTLKPTDPQRRALENLRAALDQAFDRTQASCFAAWPSSAVDRLEALRTRVEALHAAVRIVRPPLGDLNATLTDEQKARLNAVSRRTIVNAKAPVADAARTTPACADDTGGIVQQTAGALFQTVQPDADQRPGVEVLAGTLGHVAEMMKTSCPAEMPLTPMGRINAAEKRLRVMAYAISILRGPLHRFYSSLNDEQKARFDAGAAPAAPGNVVGMRPNG